MLPHGLACCNICRFHCVGALLCGVARQHSVPLYASDVAQALSMQPHRFWLVAASVLAILDLNKQDESQDAAMGKEKARLEAFLKKGVHDLVPDPGTQVCTELAMRLLSQDVSPS